FTDLAFLIPNQWKSMDPPPPKFLVFFDNITHAIEAVKYLWSCLPQEYQDKAKWFNADMTTYFKTDKVKSFKDDDTWWFCTTESFGMAN
ncbi:hypothetical protein BDR06DRAFT_837285, partial [Suillus hirtellus]